MGLKVIRSTDSDSQLHETRFRRKDVKGPKSFNYFILASFLISLTEAVPSRHVNGDKIHHYSRQLASNGNGGATNAPSSQVSTSPPEESTNYEFSTTGPVAVPNARDDDDAKYVVFANDIALMPSYEPSVNPFLSHMEQGWRLKPHKHRISKKKLDLQKQKILAGGDIRHNFINDEEAVTSLPMDPSKPHFMDSNEESAGDENKAFGAEEKDLGELFNVLFSPDYWSLT